MQNRKNIYLKKNSSAPRLFVPKPGFFCYEINLATPYLNLVSAMDHIYLNKFAFLLLVRKLRTRGVTRSQSGTRNIPFCLVECGIHRDTLLVWIKIHMYYCSLLLCNLTSKTSPSQSLPFNPNIARVSYVTVHKSNNLVLQSYLCNLWFNLLWSISGWNVTYNLS